MNIATEGYILKPVLENLNPDIQKQVKTLAQDYVNNKIEKKNLEQLGTALWQAFGDENLKKLQQQHAPHILPIIIQTQEPALLQLPWECLYHPEYQFLAANPKFTFLRRLKENLPAKNLKQGPLKVLLFTSLPDEKNTARLDVEQEEAEILEALSDWVKQGWVELTLTEEGSLPALKQHLQQDFHMIILSGHGSFNHNENLAYLLLEAEHGGNALISSQTLQEIFAGQSQLQAILFSACESGQFSSEDLNSGLASAFANNNIPFVIGMRESVLDTIATYFEKVLLSHLKQPLAIAVQQGRNEIKNLEEKSKYQGQWCLPLLFQQTYQDNIIDWNFTPQPPQVKTYWKNERSGITLPKQFIGRRYEKRQLLKAIYQKKQRQLLITGMGGQGKTALAGKLCKIFEEQEDYIIFSHSFRKKDWKSFMAQIAKALGKTILDNMQDQDDPQEILEFLIKQYKDKFILFFDNLETIQDEKGHIKDAIFAQWLEELSYFENIKEYSPIVIITSRYGIIDWNTRPQRLEHVLRPAIYGDFLRYAKGKNFPFAKEKFPEFYKKLNGNFLSFEILQGAEADFLQTLANIKTELQEYAAIKTIYHYLNNQEKILLQRLCAFTAPVLEEGIQVIGQDLAQPKKILPRLQQFSLVNTLQQPDYITYEINPLVRDWLEETQLEPEILKRAAYIQLTMFENDIDSSMEFRLATHQALQQADLKEAAAELAIKHIVPVYRLWGRYQEVLEEWLKPLLALEVNKKLQGEILNWTGLMYYYLGFLEQALDYYQQALLIRQAIGDKAGEGSTLNNISLIYHARGDYEHALSYLQQALPIQQAIGDKAGEGTTLNNISQVYDARGDYEHALSYLQQALTIRQAIGDKAGEGTTLNNISQIYHARGDYERALSYLQQALPIRQAIGDKAGEGTTLNNISQIYDARGDYEHTLSYLQQALQIRQEIGDKAGEGTTLNNISQIYHTRGDYERALSYLQQALPICQAIGDKAGICFSLFNIAAIYLETEKKQAALFLFAVVYKIASTINQAQMLQALKEGAKTLGGEGLVTWAGLSQQHGLDGMDVGRVLEEWPVMLAALEKK